MSKPMLAANTPTRSVPATTAGISRSSLTCTGSRSPSLRNSLIAMWARVQRARVDDAASRTRPSADPRW